MRQSSLLITVRFLLMPPRALMVSVSGPAFYTGVFCCPGGILAQLSWRPQQLQHQKCLAAPSDRLGPGWQRRPVRQSSSLITVRLSMPPRPVTVSVSGLAAVTEVFCFLASRPAQLLPPTPVTVSVPAIATVTRMSCSPASVLAQLPSMPQQQQQSLAAASAGLGPGRQRRPVRQSSLLTIVRFLLMAPRPVTVSVSTWLGDGSARRPGGPRLRPSVAGDGFFSVTTWLGDGLARGPGESRLCRGEAGDGTFPVTTWLGDRSARRPGGPRLRRSEAGDGFFSVTTWLGDRLPPQHVLASDWKVGTRIGEAAVPGPWDGLKGQDCRFDEALAGHQPGESTWPQLDALRERWGECSPFHSLALEQAASGEDAGAVAALPSSGPSSGVHACNGTKDASVSADPMTVQEALQQHWEAWCAEKGVRPYAGLETVHPAGSPQPGQHTCQCTNASAVTGRSSLDDADAWDFDAAAGHQLSAGSQ